MNQTSISGAGLLDIPGGGPPVQNKQNCQNGNCIPKFRGERKDNMNIYIHHKIHISFYGSMVES